MKTANYEIFGESRYLEANPDIAEAVRNGDFFAGWVHYALYGYLEHKGGYSQTLKIMLDKFDGIEDSGPTPPPDLRKRVHGDEALQGFNDIGKIITICMEAALQTNSISLGEHSKILDFGCGCGRVLNWFQRLHPGESFYGTDIDKEAIAWCQENLNQKGTFSTNQPDPPLPFPDNYFDFVYVISIFTHLPEDMQFAWLKELSRVVKKKGYLFISAAGEELFPADSETAAKQFKKKGFAYISSGGTEGLPDFYQASFHTEKYISRKWRKYFKIKGIIKKGINNHQDLVICKN